MPIQSIFITPGIAVARLGGATAPVDNFHWANVEEPRYDGETTVVPGWTLNVEPDASVSPVLPDAVSFRDGDLIRPVAPFFEVWASLGPDGSTPDTWVDTPLTPTLLANEGLTEGDLQLLVVAANLKASRRAGNPDVAFGTQQPIVLKGDNHDRTPIQGISPSTAATPMIPTGRHIPLGSVQIMRSIPQRSDQAWSDTVNIEVVRFRFWPAQGLFYGPPEAAVAAPELERIEAAVHPEHAFLHSGAGWYNVATSPLLTPGDTYDVIDQLPDGVQGPSLGVVDDTCEVHFEVTLSIGGRSLSARSVAFVAPPDFGPDRRPFLSVADELNDRSSDWQDRNSAISDAELDAWVEDFFERVYESVSLFNTDRYRRARAVQLPASETRPDDLDVGERVLPQSSMGGQDRLRNELFKITRAAANNPLPLTEHARMRHRAISDLQGLEALVALDPDRLKTIIRPPFGVEAFETANRSSMQMPPFMRQSNALPLTIVGWQYELLMRWVEKTKAKFAVRQVLGLGPHAPPVDPSSRVLSEAATQRRASVLARLEAEGEGP